MKGTIDTPEQLIQFVETMNLNIDQLNEILVYSCGSIFTENHTLQERGRLLKNHFEYVQSLVAQFGANIEKPLFIDVPIFKVEIL
ncbi:MAG: hypothetical protein FGM14_12655 [Flavobacteriales bacterium]|nr:hypothetical protein [Flavobacteriales bacterium]